MSTPDTAAPPQFHDLPYLTAREIGIPAAVKRRYEDFVVEEIPAYQPSGTGDHCYFTIEKTGLATMRAVNDIARALGVKPKDIGLCGLKDARSVSIQTLSIEHVDPRRIEALEIPRIRILKVSRHTNKLRIGHLDGNRFIIKLREIDRSRLSAFQEISDVLVTRGVPNYFGQQRFGSRGDTWQLGAALLKSDFKELFDLMLGRPGPFDTGEVLEARKLYEAGDYDRAARTWPYGFRDNVRACRELAKTKGRYKSALYVIDDRLKKFYVNAYQSYLFNGVLARRIDEIDCVRKGDLAYKHDSGAVFRVEDELVESPRAKAFEISPTGPLFGERMTRPDGAIDELEQSILVEAGAKAEDFQHMRGIKVFGGRRPLRFQLHGLRIEDGADEHGDYVQMAFTLAAGCYATMILREICKDHLQEGLDEAE